MSESVGDQWGEYLRVGRRMSEHTVDAYLGDLRALLDYLGIGWGCTSRRVRARPHAAPHPFMARRHTGARRSALDDRSSHGSRS